MPGIMHKSMGIVSYNSLPKWQKKWWNFSLNDTTGIYNKKFNTKEEKISEYCLIVDNLGWEWSRENIKKYKNFLLFGEKIIPHGPVDKDFNQVWVTKQEHDQYNFFLLLKYYIEKFIKALKSKDFDLSVVFAGIIAHIIQDGCYPSHALSNSRFYEYFPHPSKIPHFHSIIDETKVILSEGKARLLGTTTEEIAFRTYILIENNIAWCKNNILKIVDAIYKRNGKLLRKLIQTVCENAVEIVSSLWYSAICVSAGRYKRKEEENLKSIYLTDFIPYYCHPGGKYPFIVKNHSIVNGKLKPLYIKEKGKIKKVRDGLGMTSFVSAKYLIDSSIFKRFRCKVGFLPVYKEGQNENTKVKFIIETSDAIKNQARPDLRYENTKKVYEGIVKPGNAIEIDIKVEDAVTFIVSAISEPEQENGNKKYPFPHIVIGEPVFLKN